MLEVAYLVRLFRHFYIQLVQRFNVVARERNGNEQDILLAELRQTLD